jgi:hypothetical protein
MSVELLSVPILAVWHGVELDRSKKGSSRSDSHRPKLLYVRLFGSRRRRWIGLHGATCNYTISCIARCHCHRNISQLDLIDATPSCRQRYTSRPLDLNYSLAIGNKALPILQLTASDAWYEGWGQRSSRSLITLIHNIIFYPFIPQNCLLSIPALSSSRSSTTLHVSR